MNIKNTILLYRFMPSEAALMTIESRSFKIGRLKDFNDPFEWIPGLINVAAGDEALAEFCTNKFIEKINKESGIICMSATGEEPVLWSQYADIHTGVAFEFDYIINEQLFEMEYTDERPILDVSRLNDDEYKHSFINKLVRRKSRGWEYEQEYRVYVNLEASEIKNGMYFQKIPENFLKKVILGYKSGLDELYVRKALDKVGLNDTEVVRAEMHQSSYLISW